MGYNTKIDWCDSSWNPVTGCLHGCEYCYARGIANRFGGDDDGAIHDISSPIFRNDNNRVAPYPFGFAPSLHRHRLSQPKKWSEPRTIFVCSMADLFGEWVPDEWIKMVFDACLDAPQHRYLFLTKNPARYIELYDKGLLPDADNMWFGSTATTPETEFFFSGSYNTFLSIEPILKPFRDSLGAGERACLLTNWIIIGAETGSRKDKIIPEASWIMDIVQNAEKAGTPVFMKESLRDIMGDCFRQEFPWNNPGTGLSPADTNTLDYADNPTV